MTPAPLRIEVVNITRCSDFGTLPGDFYIGRQIRYKGRSLKKSKYANPYHIATGVSREFVLQQYADYIYAEGLAYDVQDDLRDVKRLGCWCKPLPCHGDILVGIASHGPAKYKAIYLR